MSEESQSEFEQIWQLKQEIAELGIKVKSLEEGLGKSELSNIHLSRDLQKLVKKPRLYDWLSGALVFSMFLALFSILMAMLFLAFVIKPVQGTSVQGTPSLLNVPSATNDYMITPTQIPKHSGGHKGSHDYSYHGKKHGVEKPYVKNITKNVYNNTYNNTYNIYLSAVESEVIEGFDSDISHWDTSNVTNMDGMFQDSAFDQDISHWCVEKIKTKPINFDKGAGFEGQDHKQPNWGAPCK